MSDQQAHSRALYDHDNEEPRPSGRRRRVADWGVSEEMFDRMPGPRFQRRQAEHEIPRGGAADGRRTVVIRDDDDVLPPLEDTRPEAPEEFGSREEAIRARAEHEAVWGGDEPFAPRGKTRPEVGEEPFTPRRGPRPEVGEEPFTPRRGPRSEVGAEGRRTVRITGRPGAFAESRPARRRPPRTVGERVGARPDRIAAWAFALGMLLILVAILTSQI
jgi:hypothetical protein